jgi:hypothetical protein
LPNAFNTSLPAALAVGMPVLYHHRKDEAPIGFVKAAEIKRDGLWGSIILPAPVVGTKAFDIYQSVKAKLIPFQFSVGGVWKRLNVGGRVRLLCERLLEVSLTPCATNQYAKPTGVSSVIGVKAMDGEWLPASMTVNERINRRIAAHRLAKAKQDLALVALTLDVAALRARSSQLRAPILP